MCNFHVKSQGCNSFPKIYGRGIQSRYHFGIEKSGAWTEEEVQSQMEGLQWKHSFDPSSCFSCNDCHHAFYLADFPTRWEASSNCAANMYSCDLVLLIQCLQQVLSIFVENFFAIASWSLLYNCNNVLFFFDSHVNERRRWNATQFDKQFLVFSCTIECTSPHFIHRLEQNPRFWLGSCVFLIIHWATFNFFCGLSRTFSWTNWSSEVSSIFVFTTLGWINVCMDVERS